jgi:hypothetical protein
MSSELLSLIIDGLILFFLMFTAFFAVKLSIHLKKFKDSRKDFEALIVDLTRNIARAENSVQGLQNAAKASGEELDAQIKEARAIRDELSLLTEASENMAGRIEKASDARKTRKRSLLSEGLEKEVKAERVRKVNPVRKAIVSSEDKGGFAIRDKEFDPSGLENFLGTGKKEEPLRASKKDTSRSSNDRGLSKAEKDLYDALSNIKRRKRKVRS